MNPRNRDSNRSRKRPSHDSTVLGEIPLDTDSGSFSLHGEPVPDHVPEFVEATARYEILGELARGGMGIVYRAQDWQLQRHVAIKILRPELMDRERLIRRFIEESRVMGSLQHPGIAHVYECGHCPDGRPFHAMKLVEGQTMSSVMDRGMSDRRSLVRLLNNFAKVCMTMAYVHTQGVVHLDLKPSNFMIGEFGEVYLMDWGMAQFYDPLSRQKQFEPGVEGKNTKKKRVQGTLSYMSPEQARGETLDQRTDVFCLGAILFEILTGEVIYQGDDRVEIHQHAFEANLEYAFERLDQCTRYLSLVRLTKICLASNPNDRPMNATVLSAELSVYQSNRLEMVQQDMAKFFELSLDLFCIAGLDGFFRRVNANFSRVLGYSDAEILERPFLDFVHQDDRQETCDVMKVLRDGQPVVRFRNRYLARDGRYLELEWTAKSLPQENVIFAVARNLTD